MSALSLPDQNQMPPPSAPDALPEIEGGDVNLIPVSAVHAPLRLEFPSWINSQPSPSNPETLTLFWDGTPVNQKIWYAPIDPDDHFILAPLPQLTNGVHVAHYDLKVFNGIVTPSGPTTLTIDRAAPVLSPTDALIFPGEVIANGVTALYLDAHDDKLTADLARYDDPKPGDTITWFWDEMPSERNEAGRKTLVLLDIGKPLTVSFPGDVIRASGDGPRHAYYEIRDRAGNLSPLSRSVTLESAATPVSRNLPWPAIKDAVGTGERVTLAPEKAAMGSTVIVPDEADILPTETIWVQWAESGQLGFYRTSTPDAGYPRRFTVPRDYVAPQIGKQLSVSYEAKGPASTITSSIRQLSVQPLDPTHLPMIQIAGHTGTSLSLASIPADGVPLILGTWPLMATTQRVQIRVSGVAANGQPVETMVLDRHPVTDAELVAGISARVVRHFMAGLKLNTAFTIMVFVSFDQGVSWPPIPNFPSNRNITLVA